MKCFIILFFRLLLKSKYMIVVFFFLIVVVITLSRIPEREQSTPSLSFGRHQECEFAALGMSSYAALLLIFFLENSKICDWRQIKLHQGI